MENIQKITKLKVDADAGKGIQNYAEKIITDIINRSSLLAKHLNKEVIDASEISIIVERDFDMSFGLRHILEENNLPTGEHVEKLAEISRQR